MTITKLVCSHGKGDEGYRHGQHGGAKLFSGAQNNGCGSGLLCDCQPLNGWSRSLCKIASYTCVLYACIFNMAANLLWVFQQNFYIMVVIIYDLVGASMCECGSAASAAQANWWKHNDKDRTGRTRINRRTINDYENVVHWVDRSYDFQISNAHMQAENVGIKKNGQSQIF